MSVRLKGSVLLFALWNSLHHFIGSSSSASPFSLYFSCSVSLEETVTFRGLGGLFVCGVVPVWVVWVPEFPYAGVFGVDVCRRLPQCVLAVVPLTGGVAAWDTDGAGTGGVAGAGQRRRWDGGVAGVGTQTALGVGGPPSLCGWCCPVRGRSAPSCCSRSPRSRAAAGGRWAWGAVERSLLELSA